MGHSDSFDSVVNAVEHKLSEKVDKMVSEGTSLFAVPDMTSVLYSESYNKFAASKKRVVPESQCWGPCPQTLYIGCRGGQILAVDSESGVVTILANPQVIKVW